MTVSELCERAELDEQARELAQPGMPVRAYVEQLAAGRRLREAAGALAQLLPRRDAISWGLESVRLVTAAGSQPKAGPAFEAVEQWLDDDSDERRRAALPAAEQTGIGTPAGCLALAVFFSGGSIAPPDTQVAPEPAPHLSGKMVALAMSLAVALDPQNEAQHLRVFLDRGFKSAADLKIWEEK